MNTIIKTIEQYRKHYFPKEWKRQKLKNMTSKELGEYLAKNLLVSKEVLE